MNKLLLSVLCLLAVFAAAVPCLADTVNGVLAEERVVNLPQDQSKWYVSVVGNATDSRYNEIVGWFDTNASLKKLKNQVQFLPGHERHGRLSSPLCRQREGFAHRADAEGGRHRGLRSGREVPAHDGGRLERCLGRRGQYGPRDSADSALATGHGASVPWPLPESAAEAATRSRTPSRSRSTTTARRTSIPTCRLSRPFGRWPWCAWSVCSVAWRLATAASCTTS